MRQVHQATFPQHFPLFSASPPSPPFPKSSPLAQCNYWVSVQLFGVWYVTILISPHIEVFKLNGKRVWTKFATH